MNNKRLTYLITSCLSVYGQKCDENQLRIWLIVLREYDIELLTVAFYRLIKTRKYSSAIIVPAEIISLYEAILDEIKNEYSRAIQDIQIDKYEVIRVGSSNEVRDSLAYQEECARIWKSCYNSKINKKTIEQ